MSTPVRVLLVGAGNMGASHGRAYASLDGFELCGVVSRGESGVGLAAELGGVPHFRDVADALATTTPDAVGIVYALGDLGDRKSAASLWTAPDAVSSVWLRCCIFP